MEKIIYFDKETINNLLQQKYEGDYITENITQKKSETNTSVESGIETEVKWNVPFLTKAKFLFTGKISYSYFRQFNEMTTVSSTEISEFKNIKSELFNFQDARLEDVTNSSTLFRAAGSILRMLNSEVEDINKTEFTKVMENFEGYDTYKIVKDGDIIYVRFNSTAFISNYKRFDILKSKMKIYCIQIGEFTENEFDFIEQMNSMQQFFVDVNSTKKIGDLFPSPLNNTEETQAPKGKKENNDISGNSILLYDVVYAAIPIESKEEIN